MVNRTTQRRMGEVGQPEDAWTEDILRRIDELIGDEGDEIEDVVRKGRVARSPTGGKEGTRPTRGGSSSPRAKNTIPSDVLGPCARSLEVWICDLRLRPGERMADAYEHVSNTCRGTTDLVVFRGTTWDQHTWTANWEGRFTSLRNLARSRVALGEEVNVNRVLGNLHVALKLYGKRHPVVRLIP